MNIQKLDEGQPHASVIDQHLQAMCGAKTRKGTPCQSFKVTGRKRCRMHGGAMGSGAPKGNKNAYKHGQYSKEYLESRHSLTVMMKHVNKNGEVDFDTTRKESLNELIASQLDFNKQLNNLLKYFAGGLVTGWELNCLLAKAKKEDKIKRSKKIIKSLNECLPEVLLECPVP